MSSEPTAAFADLWELVYDELDSRGETDRDALVIFGRDERGTGRRTFAELEENANRFAAHLRSLGVGHGDRVALYLENRPEYLEALLGSYKVRASPINVNFRYVESELAHLLGDCAAKVVLHEQHFAKPLATVRDQLPDVEHTIEMDGAFDEILAASDPTRVDVERSGDDHYILYTGGTTGLPKGVVWRQEDAFYSCLGGGDPTRMMGQVERVDELPERIVDAYNGMLLAPFMHAAGSWVTVMINLAGGKAILPRGPLDAELVWDTVDAEQAHMMTVIGDAVGRPVLEAWLANPGRWDAGSLFAMSNGGAPMSAALKTRIAETFPSLILTDGFGSSEAGTQGTSRLSAEAVKAAKGVAQFEPGDDTTAVLDADDRPLEPGSPETGRVARTGRLPLGYLNDEKKTAETFVTIDGTRWLITGDLARVAADGTIELLGRDSATINTGGEKVHGEEVENVLKAHPSVYDVVVVGAPDERWGSRVTAVVQPVPGEEPTLDELSAYCRSELAGFKVPKSLVLVDEVVRSPAGKADLGWAKSMAAEGART
ncbi:MAG: AMP-binding protein [Acidimicrobiales bacterium]|nr:AMP-binding protein [Acidimicrobiales bacterium]